MPKRNYRLVNGSIMASLDGRGALENSIARMIGREFGRLATDMEQWLVSQGVTQGVRYRLPLAQWDDFTGVFGRNIQGELEDIYTLAAQQFQDNMAYNITDEQIQAAAEAWAEDRARNLVRQLNTTSNRRLNRLLDRYWDKPTTLAEFQRQLTNYVFAPERARASAITEITRASAAAQEAIANDLREQGVGLRTIWQTNNDEMVCPICGPRHGMAQGTDWFDLPPAHVNCRCFTTHEVVYLSEVGEKMYPMLHVGQHIVIKMWEAA